MIACPTYQRFSDDFYHLGRLENLFEREEPGNPES
jgi:hypothetical protein